MLTTPGGQPPRGAMPFLPLLWASPPLYPPVFSFTPRTSLPIPPSRTSPHLVTNRVNRKERKMEDGCLQRGTGEKAVVADGSQVHFCCVSACTCRVPLSSLVQRTGKRAWGGETQHMGNLWGSLCRAPQRKVRQGQMQEDIKRREMRRISVARKGRH